MCTGCFWKIKIEDFEKLVDFFLVVGSAQFEIHGLKPNTQYEARAMVVLANDNIGSSVKFSAKIGFTSGQSVKTFIIKYN
jgi:hypothetical protein